MHKRFYFEAVTNDNEIIRPVIRAVNQAEAKQKLSGYNVHHVIDFDTKPLRRYDLRSMVGISTNTMM